MAPSPNVVIAVPARMSSVLRQAVVDEMQLRFPRLTIALEEQAILIPRFARLTAGCDWSVLAEDVREISPSAITRYLATKFPLLHVGRAAPAAPG
jgi:hypothetical protein